MNLINKEVKWDTNTFEPVMYVTVKIPMEIMRDGEDEVKRILGIELYELLSTSKE